jgi:uncharacterized membrane protein YtjA (UPF0391 family)
MLQATRPYRDPCCGEESPAPRLGPKVATGAATSSRSPSMLYYAVVFLIIAVIAGILGFWGLAATAAWIAKIIFVVFLILALISFLRRA